MKEARSIYADIQIRHGISVEALTVISLSFRIPISLLQYFPLKKVRKMFGGKMTLFFDFPFALSSMFHHYFSQYLVSHNSVQLNVSAVDKKPKFHIIFLDSWPILLFSSWNHSSCDSRYLPFQCSHRANRGENIYHSLFNVILSLYSCIPNHLLWFWDPIKK